MILTHIFHNSRILYMETNMDNYYDSTWTIHGYPLVNVYKKLWNPSPCSMGKSTISIISMVIFNSFLLVITRGYP